MSYLHFLKKYKVGTVVGFFIALFSLVIMYYSFDCPNKGLRPEELGPCSIFSNHLTGLILLPFIFLGGLVIIFSILTLGVSGGIFYNVPFFHLFITIILFGFIGALIEKVICQMIKNTKHIARIT